MTLAYLPGHEPRDNGQPPEPPDDMQARVQKIEAAVQQMQTDLAVLRADSKHYATKEDLAKLEAKVSDNTTRLIMWIVSAVVLAQLMPFVLKKLGA